MILAFAPTPLRRFARLVRQTALRQKTPIAPVNEERLARLKLIQFGPPEYRPWLLAFNCTTCGRGASDMAHVISRGAGGTWKETVPMCRRCHTLQHQKGWGEIARRTGWEYAILLVKAREFAARFVQTHPGTMARFKEEVGHG